MIIKTILTLGIYPSVWLYKNNQYFFQKSKTSFFQFVPFMMVLALIGGATCSVLSFAIGQKKEQAPQLRVVAMEKSPEDSLADLKRIAFHLEKADQQIASLNRLGQFFQVLHWVLLFLGTWVLSKHALSQSKRIKLNSFFIFAGTIFYLQHQINKSMAKES